MQVHKYLLFYKEKKLKDKYEMEMMMMRKIGKQASEMKNNSEIEATSRAAYAQRGTKDVKIKRNHTTLNYKYFDKIFKEYLHALHHYIMRA